MPVTYYSYNSFNRPCAEIDDEPLTLAPGVALYANGVLVSTAAPLPVTGTFTADSEFPTATLLADNTATPTTTSVGAFCLVYDGANWDFLRGTAADGALVNLGTNNDVTVTSGAITETNSAAIAASVSVLDDWDETNRAAVNTIAGQVGVQGASGAVTALTQRVVLATDVALPTGSNTIGAVTNVPLTNIGAGDYEPVAASQTDQMCGGAGAVGDWLAGVLIIPTTTSPGAVSIEDGSTNTVIFDGGASSVSNLVPFYVPCGFTSVNGGWEITTGANVRAIAGGNFT
jgi:hypothetical protein